MKALSLTQPWASLIFDRRKTIETRSWATRYRGPLAIHAAGKIDRAACLRFGYDPDAIPRAAVLGTVFLDDCVRFTPEFVAKLSEGELLAGNFDLGRFGFELTTPQKFDKPIPARGALGLWEWEVPA